jgi:tRNA ligase
MTNKMVDDTNERTPPQASTSKIMYSPALSEADKSVTQELLDSLYNFGKGPESDTKLSKLLKHTDHAVAKDESDDTYTLTSWKMQDYAYKQDPCPYPTRARGLFTIGKDRIVARAYDKFFNVDEVSWTKVC